MPKLRLSIFGRLALGFGAIIAVLAAVNVYVLLELRQFTTLNTELVSQHYPAIDSARWLINSLYEQLKNEKQYRVVGDPDFLRAFHEEVSDFERVLSELLKHEAAGEGRELLTEVKRRHDDYLSLTDHKAGGGRSRHGNNEDYDLRRDSLIDRVTTSLQSYVSLQEASIGSLLKDSRARSMRAESLTQQLIVITLFLGLGLAGLVSYSILQPIRRLQVHIRQIGYGNFGTPLEVQGPHDLKELVEAVSWMRRKLQELDEMKSDFLAHVTHELRTPLTSIHTGTQLLLEEIAGPITAEQQEMLRMMIDNSRRLIEMISALLDLSKIDAGMMQYRLAPTDIKEVLEISVGKVRLLADGRQVRLMLEMPQQAIMLSVDRTRIEQVVDNLLSNAVKFSPPGGIVQVRLILDRGAGTVRVAVSDTGPGIPPDSLPRIFDRFYQGPVLADGVSGTGLGLALAKKVVEGHGGRIWAESDLGKGTTVQFVLPYKETRCVDVSSPQIGQEPPRSDESTVSLR
jgi:two-component system sensor histidine kinase GlrK